MQNQNGQEWNQDIQLPTHDLLFVMIKIKPAFPETGIGHSSLYVTT